MDKVLRAKLSVWAKISENIFTAESAETAEKPLLDFLFCVFVGFSQFLIVVFLAKKDRFEFLQLMASGLSCQKYEGQKHDASMDTWFFG